MAAEMKAQIVKNITKILSDGLLIYTKVNRMGETTDPIKGSEMLVKLAKVKDMVEELSQMEIVDTKHDVPTPEIVSAVSASTPGLLAGTLIAPTASSFQSNVFDESTLIDNLFVQLELVDDEDSNANDYDDEYDDEEAQGWPCSIRDICDYDSDTGICEY